MTKADFLEVARWNREQAAGAREMAERARQSGRDDAAIQQRESYASHHDRVAARAEEIAAEWLAEGE